MEKSELEDQIREAIRAHGGWKLKLSTAAKTGELPKPAADIATDNQCSFGKWLGKLKSDADVSRSDHYRAVVDAHANFHRAAGQVASLVEGGDLEAADRSLNGSQYLQATQSLTEAMATWRRST